jgi:hypothetical protein
MPDYIPATDAGFDTWQNQFLTYLNANLAALGLTATDTDVVSLTAAWNDWQARYPAHAEARLAAQAATQAKDASRRAYVAVIRRLVSRLQASAQVDDAERAALGITVPDREPTSAPAPETRPVLQADTSQRLRILVAFADEGRPDGAAKPPGVTGCEIYVKVGGAPPTDLDDCVYLGTDTRTPYLASFDGSQAGQTAHFVGRWVNSRGDTGPISETVSATIPA